MKYVGFFCLLFLISCGNQRRHVSSVFGGFESDNLKNNPIQLESTILNQWQLTSKNPNQIKSFKIETPVKKLVNVKPININRFKKKQNLLNKYSTKLIKKEHRFKKSTNKNNETDPVKSLRGWMLSSYFIGLISLLFYTYFGGYFFVVFSGILIFTALILSLILLPQENGGGIWLLLLQIAGLLNLLFLPW